MKKGQSARATVEVASNCARAGISVTFYAMVGFPSETRPEARATLDFILDNADVVREVSLQTFHIECQSGVVHGHGADQDSGQLGRRTLAGQTEIDPASLPLSIEQTRLMEQFEMA